MDRNRREEHEGTERWWILGELDWEEPGELALTVDAALRQLGALGEGVVYDYIDLDAVRTVLRERPDGRGAHQIRFDCNDHEIRIDGDGTVAARPVAGYATLE